MALFSHDAHCGQLTHHSPVTLIGLSAILFGLQKNAFLANLSILKLIAKWASFVVEVFCFFSITRDIGSSEALTLMFSWNHLIIDIPISRNTVSLLILVTQALLLSRLPNTVHRTFSCTRSLMSSNANKHESSADNQTNDISDNNARVLFAWLRSCLDCANRVCLIVLVVVVMASRNDNSAETESCGLLIALVISRRVVGFVEKIRWLFVVCFLLHGHPIIDKGFDIGCSFLQAANTFWFLRFAFAKQNDSLVASLLLVPLLSSSISSYRVLIRQTSPRAHLHKKQS